MRWTRPWQHNRAHRLLRSVEPGSCFPWHMQPVHFLECMLFFVWHECGVCVQESEKEPRRQDLYFTVQETHGASLPPIMHPRQPHAVAYATGPFIVIWDWKSDHKQVCFASSCLFERGTHARSRAARRQSERKRVCLVLSLRWVPWQCDHGCLHANALPFPYLRSMSFLAAASTSPACSHQHMLQSLGMQIGVCRC